MSTNDSPDLDQPMTVEEHQSALFANLVLQQTNMAMMLMGKIAHPDAGKPVRDLEAAHLFIDQIEMLQAKTRGNLSPNEEKFLQQTLTNLRMTFVQAVESGEPREQAPEPQSTTSPAQPSGNAPSVPAAEPPPAEPSGKKFTKKY